MPQNRSQAAPSRPHPVIVLTGGGSGGHITPLLSLAHALKRLEPAAKIIYIGLKGEKTKSLSDRYDVFDSTYFISAGKFRRYHGQNLLSRLLDLKTLLLNIVDFFKFAAGTLSAAKLMGRLKPDAVFSKGGFVAVPVGIAARTRNVPIVTHDSDVIPGLANRILNRWAVAKTIGMPKDLRKKDPNYVGIPLDDRIKEVSPGLKKNYRKDLNINDTDKVLLAGGAGLGSRDINLLLVRSSTKLFELVPRLKILHFAGDAHKADIASKYAQTLNPQEAKSVEIIGFSNDFYKYTGAADLIVARAGATTIAELALQKKAAVLIPAAFLAGGHQLENAKTLKSLEAVELADASMSPEEFAKQTASLLGDSARLKTLGRNIGLLAKPHAAQSLARIVLEAASKPTSQ